MPLSECNAECALAALARLPLLTAHRVLFYLPTLDVYRLHLYSCASHRQVVSTDPVFRELFLMHSTPHTTDLYARAEADASLRLYGTLRVYEEIHALFAQYLLSESQQSAYAHLSPIEALRREEFSHICTPGLMRLSHAILHVPSSQWYLPGQTDISEVRAALLDQLQNATIEFALDTLRVIIQCDEQMAYEFWQTLHEDVVRAWDTWAKKVFLDMAEHSKRSKMQVNRSDAQNE